MEISVVVRNSVKVKGAAFIPDTEEFVGNLMKNPSWIGEDCICLSTGQKSFPFRVIPKSDIVSSTKHFTTAISNRKMFEAKGSKGNVYTITKDGSAWACTCTGFGFRHDCKHIRAAKKYDMKGK